MNIELVLLDILIIIAIVLIVRSYVVDARGLESAAVQLSACIHSTLRGTALTEQECAR